MSEITSCDVRGWRLASLQLHCSYVSTTSTMISLSMDNVVASLLQDYVNPKKWSSLIEELHKHKYVNVYSYINFWFMLKRRGRGGRGVTESVKAILYINTDSVILQDVEKNWEARRFTTFKVMFEDWDTVFASWSDERQDDWDDCMEEGFNMYTEI